MVSKSYDGDLYDLEALVSFGLYNNCSYDNVNEALKDAVAYMKSSDVDQEVTITLRWY